MFADDDFVRIELQSAREVGTPVVPVLVNGAAMPKTQDLPETLQWLTTLQAFELRDHRWEVDVQSLATELGSLLAKQRTSLQVLICMARCHREHKESWDTLYAFVDQLEDQGIRVKILIMAGRRDEQSLRSSILGQAMVMACLWPRDASLIKGAKLPLSFKHFLATLGLLPAFAYEQALFMAHNVAEDRSPMIPLVWLDLGGCDPPPFSALLDKRVNVRYEMPKLMALIDAELASLRTQPYEGFRDWRRR